MKLLIQNITLSILLSFISFTAICQTSVEEKNNEFRVYDHYKLIDTLHATPAQIAEVHHLQKIRQLTKDHYYYEFPYAGNLGIRFDNGTVKSEVYEGLSWGDRNFNKSIIIDGDCSIELSALDVTEKNAADYRYRVVQNDNKELITWTAPSTFKYTSDKRFKFAYLGLFKYVPGQVLKVEIYNTKNFRQQDAMLIDWRKVEAADVGGFIQFTTHSFHVPDNGLVGVGLNQIKHPERKLRRLFMGKYVNGRLPASERFIETTSLNDIKFRLGDSLQNISFDIANGKKLYNYRVSLEREVDGYTDSIDFGETNDKFVLYKEFWKNPGKYKITFTPKIHKHGGVPIILLHKLATTISFTVLPALNVSHSIPLRAVILMAFVLSIVIALLFLYYRKRQKRILDAEAQRRQIATLQLQSVRSQLNPHFMFNALAGIQNLMNKNEVELANKYLARFARITRNVLDDGNKELTTIEHEADLLNDYLQMEQMRFGFEFRVDIDDIDQQIEIPAMLLQPFVENAVKHGVSALKNRGLITVGIGKKDNDLILSVQDNGKGFSNDKTTGIGIKLCEERIKLLNSIHKNTTILLHKHTHSHGTLISIELKNWL